MNIITSLLNLKVITHRKRQEEDTAGTGQLIADMLKRNAEYESVKSGA